MAVHGFLEDLQHVRDGVWGRPVRHARVQRRPALEGVAAPLPSVGGAAGLAVGLAHLPRFRQTSWPASKHAEGPPTTRTVTLNPYLASSAPQHSPPIPAPTTTTSASWPRGPGPAAAPDARGGPLLRSGTPALQAQGRPKGGRPARWGPARALPAGGAPGRSARPPRIPSTPFVARARRQEISVLAGPGCRKRGLARTVGPRGTSSGARLAAFAFCFCCWGTRRRPKLGPGCAARAATGAEGGRAPSVPRCGWWGRPGPPGGGPRRPPVRAPSSSRDGGLPPCPARGAGAGPSPCAGRGGPRGLPAPRPPRRARTRSSRCKGRRWS